MRSTLLIALPLLLATPVMAQSRVDAPYRAVGTEPFWSLTINRNTIAYRPAQGRLVTVAKPRPIVGFNGELYRARGLTVDITHVPCSDGMSDRRYADTVKVTVGRRTLSGCGGAIVPDDAIIADTRWTISAIDGRTLRLERPATIDFTANRIQGRICNSFGGPYRFARGTLSTSNIVTTRMACAGALGQAERDVFRIIARPLKVHRGNPNTLVLSDSAGNITLRRAR